MATLAGNVIVGFSTNAALIGGVITFSGTRTFTVSNSPSLSSDLIVNAAVRGSGALTKLGPGKMALTASNSYAGFTTVRAGQLHVLNSFGLGATNVGTVVEIGTKLILEGGVHVGLEALTFPVGFGLLPFLASLAGSNSWAGAITLNESAVLWAYTGDILNVTGPIRGDGGLSLEGQTPSGTIILSGTNANTFAGYTSVHRATVYLRRSVPDGAIPGDFFIVDGATVRMDGGTSQIYDLANVTIGPDSQWELSTEETISSLSGGGRVLLGPTGLNINPALPTTYSGVISGAGHFYKYGPGVATLAGSNTYTGLTHIFEGTMVINGSQQASPVQVDAAGTLAGSGVVGNLNVIGGDVRPGTSPGILTSSNVAFTAASDFFVEINGNDPGTGYDQLNVRGTNQLGGATLQSRHRTLRVKTTASLSSTMTAPSRLSVPSPVCPMAAPSSPVATSIASATTQEAMTCGWSTQMPERD